MGRQTIFLPELKLAKLGICLWEFPLEDSPIQTWKNAQTCRHCMWKFFRIVESSGLWMIIFSYSGIKPCKMSKFLLKYQIFGMMISTIDQFTCEHFEKCILRNTFSCWHNVSAEGLRIFPCLLIFSVALPVLSNVPNLV